MSSESNWAARSRTSSPSPPACATASGSGHNTVAALITRGLAEITRLVVACGGRPETMAGLAGLGDLVLTCTGGLSRNRSVGVELGHGRKLNDIIAGMHGMVAEGVLTTNAAIGLARKMGVEMPITEQMHAILQQGKSPQEAIRDLMARPSTSESGSDSQSLSSRRPTCAALLLRSRSQAVEEIRHDARTIAFRHQRRIEHVLQRQRIAQRSQRHAGGVAPMPEVRGPAPS